MADKPKTPQDGTKMSTKNTAQQGTPDSHGVVVSRPDSKTKTKRPPLYKVMIVNDDFTPMDFVVFILKSQFHCTHEDAVNIMNHVHISGSGNCGIYTRDVAETKVEQVLALSRQNEHPLCCIMEKE